MPVFAGFHAGLVTLAALIPLIVTAQEPGPSLSDGSGGTPWWAWLSIVAATAALGGVAWIYRRNLAQDETIRRQLAHESSLKARLDDLFERTSEILVVHDRRGRVSTINRAGEHATGYSREELRSLDSRWIFAADYLDTVTQMIEEGSDSSARTFKSELMARKGRHIPIDVHSRVLIGADLAKAVERLQPGVKVLFISGHPERAGVGLNPTGVTNLLMKPFAADTLATRIKELIAAKQQGAEGG